MNIGSDSCREGIVTLDKVHKVLLAALIIIIIIAS